MDTNSATGSIRGFNTLDLGQGQTAESISPTNFSLTDLKFRIDEIRRTYDPDFLDSLIVSVLSHIQNENNPHQVTLTETGANVINIVYQAWLANGNTGTLQDFYVTFFQVSDISTVAGADALTGSPTSLITVSGVDALIAEHNADPEAHAALLDIIMPGTPPEAPPTAAFNAQFGIPYGATSSRSTALNVLDQNGNIVIVPPNTVAIDYSTGTGSFPLYGVRTNLIYPSNPITRPTGNVLNATHSLSPSGTLKVGPDGQACMVLTETTSGNVIHGYQLSGVSVTDGVEYTDSVFIYPLTNVGGILLYLDAYSTIAIMVNLSDYSVTTQNSNVFGYVQAFPNGWLRIGIQYVAPASATINLNIIKTQTTNFANSTSYVGTGALMFGIFGLQHVAGCGMSPYIPTSTGTASHDSTTITIPLTLGNASSGLLAVSYNHPETAGSQTRVMLSLENNIIGITISENFVYATTQNIDSSSTLVQSSDEVFDSQAILAFSYAPTICKLACTGSPKTTESSTPINLVAGATSIVLGSSTAPFDGAISSLVLYPISDTNEEIEFFSRRSLVLESKVSYVALEQLGLSIEEQEGLEAYRFVHRIFDAFGRILFNIKTTLTSFDKKFKRSELRFYHESKRLGIANLYKSKHFNKDMMVPIPSGMKITYLEAVNSIDSLLEKLDIESTTDKIISYLKETPLTDPSILTKTISKLDKAGLEKDLRKVFSSEKTLEVPLHTVIPEFEEILDLDNKILAYEKIFKQVPIICEKLGLIEKYIDDIVTDLEKRDEIDRKFVKSLHTLIRTAAFQFDAFGVLLAEAQRVEHNFVFVLHKLVMDAARH